MEKLKKALERAQATRSIAHRSEWRQQEVPSKGGGSCDKIIYTKTKTIDVQSDTLRDKCIIADSDNHAVTGAYKVLRTHVLQRMRSNNWNTLAITSPTGGNGKTVTAINLAISLSKDVNQTVLLVDLALRRPTIQKYFSLKDLTGISDYLSGDIELSEILFNPGIERLVILPGNKPFDNSSEMLSSPKMVNLVKEIKNYYPGRIIIFDTPPILSCDDTLAFSPFVDSLMLVIEDSKTKKAELERAIQLIDKEKLIGTILNKSSDTSLTYNYAY
jgi:capsular exopolysaccharide synthesis family protein